MRALCTAVEYCSNTKSKASLHVAGVAKVAAALRRYAVHALASGSWLAKSVMVAESGGGSWLPIAPPASLDDTPGIAQAAR